MKWAGGKTRYVQTLTSYAPPDFCGYYEPFLGSGALFFELHPQTAVLSDSNAELMMCFRMVRDDPHAVMECLDGMLNTREYFEEVRRRDPIDCSELERAARVVYLNKTSFRGLWRVNRRGEFNTPYGAYNRPYYNRDVLLNASKALTDATLIVSDFEERLDAAIAGDWVYLDPPYAPLGGWADFRRYTADQFVEKDHRRLRAAMCRADRRGVFVLMTNSDTPFVWELFVSNFRVLRLVTRRDISVDAQGRGSSDLVVANYDLRVPGSLPG